jgi:hypothetical protein
MDENKKMAAVAFFPRNLRPLELNMDYTAFSFAKLWAISVSF